MLIKIGEAAAQYEISNRSLRYWEEAGILQSMRSENGYRYYDDSNLRKIKQIVFLRKLRLPLQEIHQILLSEELKMTVDILQRHLEEITGEAQALENLRVVLEQLLVLLQAKNSLTEAAQALDAQNPAALTLLAALKSTLSERKINMATNSDTIGEVRIVALPKMHLVTYCAVSATPEDDCNKMMEQFIEQHHLRELPGFRRFGYNNPDPKEGNPVYGYEMWAVIPGDLPVEPPYQKRLFSGGLFASIPCRLSNIGERWKLLGKWVMNNPTYKYHRPVDLPFVGLEESLCPTLKENEQDFQLDLLVPVVRKEEAHK